jgi:hypothetical protein
MMIAHTERAWFEFWSQFPEAKESSPSDLIREVLLLFASQTQGFPREYGNGRWGPGGHFFPIPAAVTRGRGSIMPAGPLG